MSIEWSHVLALQFGASKNELKSDVLVDVA